MKFEYSAGAFIYRKSTSGISLLLLKKEGRDAYDLPKGHIEKGETAEQAAIREIKEETGLTVQLFNHFHISTHYVFTSGKEKISKSVKFFISKTNSSKVKISEEHIGYEWAPIKKAGPMLKHKDLLKILPKVAEYIEKTDKMQELNNEYAKLPEGSKEWDLSKNFVPGEGPLDTGTMFIGQAPGANEDLQKRPFVGRSGMLLDRLLNETKVYRKNIYITSVVQFFPPKNREPSKEEIEKCKPFILRQILILKPDYIVLLGRVAAKTILGEDSISKSRGRIFRKDGIKYIITLHPSAVLRFPKNEYVLKNDLALLADELKKDKKAEVIKDN